MRKTLVGLGLFACLLAAGCNAGVAAIAALLSKSDGGGGKKRRQANELAAVEFVALENARLRPEQAVLVVRLRDSAALAAEVLIEATVDGGSRAPATVTPPTGALLASAGKIKKLRTSTEGTLHRIPWNALTDVGTDALHRVDLRFSGDVEELVVPVQVGNDAPALGALTVTQAEGEEVVLGVQVADSSGDPVDVALEYATAEDDQGNRLFQPATRVNGQQSIPSAPEGEAHVIGWDAPGETGRFDRLAVVRLTPLDRIAGEPGKQGVPIEQVIRLNNNKAPEVEVVEADLLTSPDQRGSLGIRLRVQDAESNPVDALVQWTVGDDPFPELDPNLGADARSALLSTPADRDRLHLLEFRSAQLLGSVEEPGAGLSLASNEILTTWLGSSDGGAVVQGCEGAGCRLAGRPITLLSSGERGAQTRLACGYDLARGVLTLDQPFDPAPSSGDLLEVELGGMEATLRLSSSPEGVLHQQGWSTRGALPGGGTVRFRATAFDRVASSVAGCRAQAGAEAPGVELGAVGPVLETGGAKPLHGPFKIQDPTVIPLAPIDQPVALAAVDVDANGRMDLVLAARTSNAVLVLLQTAPGVYDTVRLSDARLRDPSGLVALDLDADGDVDLAVSDQKTGKILLVYQEAGQDFFSNRVALDAGGALKRPTAITSGDLDQDGDIDLAVTEAGGTERGVRVFFRGGGAGGCTELERGYASCFLSDPNDEEPRAIAAARVTRDSTYDLVTAGKGFFALYSLNFTQGGLGLRYLRVDAPGSDLFSVAVADLDQNGRFELVAPDRAGRALTIASQTGGGEPTFGLLAPIASSGLKGPLGIVEGDLDQNGVIDFAIADPGDPAGQLGGNVCVFLGSTRGEYSVDSLERPSPRGTPDSPRAVAIADFDGDGRPDIAAADDGTHEVVIYSQGGHGVFNDAPDILASAQKLPAPASLAALDSNGDLRTDLVAANREADSLTLFEQGSAGVFAAMNLKLPGIEAGGGARRRGPVAAASGDLNGDGRPDIVCADLDSNDLLALFQDERGDFLATPILAEGFRGPQSVTLADLDRDGHLDVLAAARFSDEARWFRRGGDGQFAEGGVFRQGAAEGAPHLLGPVVAAAGDLDGDGTVDVVTANHRSSNLLIFLQGEGPGVFLEPIEVSLGAANRPVAVVLSDLDGSGTLDIAAANLGSTAVSIFIQGPDGTLSSREIPSLPGVQATSLAVQDVTFDARPDVVVAFSGHGGSFLNVYPQQVGPDPFSPESFFQLSAPGLLAPIAVLAVDLDGDGEPDLTSANRQSRNVTVFYGGR